jgi:serine/threonine-protein kinase
MDFGLAKSVADAHPTIVEAIVGTPRYMAPEQILGSEIGPEADYFSLGLVAWEMLTGQPLLPQTDWVGLLRHRANWDMSRLDEQRRRVDLTTYDFLRHALHPEPRQRRVDLNEVASWAGPVDVSRLEGFA